MEWLTGLLSRREIARSAWFGVAVGRPEKTAYRAAGSNPPGTQTHMIFLPSLKQDSGGIQAVDVTAFLPGAPVELVADGYWAAGDAGGGRFRWDSMGTEMEDGFIFFAPARGSGRWQRIVDPTNLRFEMAGARGDGVQNDFVPCQQMLLIASRRFRNCRVTLRSGAAYLLDYSPEALRHQITRDSQPGGASLMVPAHCIIEGAGGALAITARGVPDLATASRFVLHPRMTVRLDYFAELRDIQIVRKNMMEAIDHFSLAGPSTLEDMQEQINLWMSEDGTSTDRNGGVRSVAITNGGTDTKVERALVLGFHTAYLSDGFSRPIVDQLYFDTAGRGVEISRSADDAYVRSCYSNAFWSSNLGTAKNEHGDNARRPGIAFDFHDKADGLRCSDCSGIGWAIGLRLSNVWAATISGLNVEPALHPPQEVTRGVLAENCVSHTTFIAPLIDGFTYKMDFQHRPAGYAPYTGENGSGGLGQYASASITVIGGSIQGNPADPKDHRAFRLGPHSSGVLMGITLAGFPSRPAILAESEVGVWKVIAVSPSFGEHQPLFEFSDDADRPRVLRFACDPIDEARNARLTVAGRVVLDELPVSPAGLAPGSIWRDGVMLKVAT